MARAKAIILTPEGGRTTDERWARETPYLTGLLGPRLNLRPEQLLVDLGCGVGRMSRALMAAHRCFALGVDISPDMRAMAPGYVGADGFSALSGEMFATLVDRGLTVDAAISIWVLQHTLSPAEEIARLKAALKPGGRIGVVNNIGRVVPTLEKFWASDGIDVRQLLRDAFTPVEEGQLDAAHVGDVLARGAFWGVYEKA
jgi:SAM-dependent methyltransferase